MAHIDYNCLQSETYIRFIEEAVKRSDSLSLYVNKISDNFEFTNKESLMNMGFSQEECNAFNDKIYHKYLEDKSVFYKKTVPFVERLKPLIIDSYDGRTCTVYLLRSDEEIIPILCEIKSIKDWGFPNFPDDLSFISKNKYWFVCENHESNAMLYPNSIEDYYFWKDLGIHFVEAFDYKRDVLDRLSVDFK